MQNYQKLLTIFIRSIRPHLHGSIVFKVQRLWHYDGEVLIQKTRRLFISEPPRPRRLSRAHAPLPASVQSASHGQWATEWCHVVEQLSIVKRCFKVEISNRSPRNQVVWHWAKAFVFLAVVLMFLDTNPYTIFHVILAGRNSKKDVFVIMQSTKSISCNWSMNFLKSRHLYRTIPYHPLKTLAIPLWYLITWWGLIYGESRYSNWTQFDSDSLDTTNLTLPWTDVISIK